ncbi:MAG: hypothetical protein CL693_20335 [Cellvibrionaceae bacterium]|nr:hypothetical protein [Cellvibrionaceae bacterium]|tara:strand:+ start:22540 stop:24072 length:1533 start_codon:yes stop_codon:yes gene_type:complete
MLVHEHLEYFSRAYRDSPCLIQGQHNITYGQLHLLISQYAQALQARGVVAHQRVAVLSENSIEQLIVFYACVRLGAVYLPLNFRLAAKELDYIVGDADATVLLVGSESLMPAVRAMACTNQLDVVVLAGEVKSQECSKSEFLQAGSGVQLLPLSVLEDDTVYQMYTSGTTGRPKGVMISHRQLVSFLSAYATMPPHRAEGTPHLAVAPLFHAAAFTLALAALSIGRPVVILPQFEPLKVLQSIETYRVSDTLLVPAMLHAVVAAAKQFTGDLSSLLSVTYGGSPISVSQLVDAVETLGCDFQQGFGMTEMVTGVIWLTPDDHRRALATQPELLRSCGRVAPFNQVKVVDPETRQDCPSGEVGEILLSGAQMMQGYWRLPEKTASALEGGWYHSGDAGYLDDDGYLYIKDRLKDMIVSGGENVYPAEVEAALVTHEGIADVAVIGEPDEKFGEAVVAVCVATEGQLPSDSALIDFCRDHIAGYKIPRKYRFVEALPRNAAGKVLKDQLRNA